MRRTLLVTNDFPPVVGGIQSYLDDFTTRLPADDLEVLASTPSDGSSAAVPFDTTRRFPIHRVPTHVLLPTPALRRRMTQIIREERIETVWFGASVPLGLLGPAAKRAGASRVIATTHGHEVGWSMTPGASLALRKVFASADVVTYISDYTRKRLAPSIPSSAQLVHLPSGIDTDRFHSDPEARSRLRARYGIDDAPTVVCISRLVRRKGQDALIEAWPHVVARVRDARLVIVGSGPYARHLAKLRQVSSARDRIVLTGQVPSEELPAFFNLGDVFAMPCRTRGGGLDVEGLGIVFLEASACGVPVIAGASGGAPETVRPGDTGLVVDGRDHEGLVNGIVALLSDPIGRAHMGASGRHWMIEEWTWPHLVDHLVSAINDR